MRKLLAVVAILIAITLILNGCGESSETESQEKLSQLDEDFLEAAYNCDMQAVNSLLDKGADVDCVTFAGEYTALQSAAENNHTEMADLLISRGADVEARAGDDHTPLYLASRNSFARTVEVLLKGGANVNAYCDNGETPLLTAADICSPEVASLLIAGGADINAHDNYGRTPLHHAATWGDVGMVELLLAAGADVNARDNEGITPLSEAEYGASLPSARPDIAEGIVIEEPDEAEAASYARTIEVLTSHGGVK